MASQIDHKILVIGGSAGSFDVVNNCIHAIPANYPHTIIFVIHRRKTKNNSIVEIMSSRSKIKVIEPEMEDTIHNNTIYFAPADYHLLVNASNCFVLDYFETVNHSRPSIDVTMKSFALQYKDRLIGILLSGASNDGALGLKMIQELGGVGLVQKPDTCEIPVMPKSAIDLFDVDYVMEPDLLIRFISELE